MLSLSLHSPQYSTTHSIMRFIVVHLGICLFTAVSAIQVEISHFHNVFVDSSITLTAIEGETLLEAGKNCNKIADCKLICKQNGNFMYSTGVSTYLDECAPVHTLLGCWTKQKSKIMKFAKIDIINS